MEPLNCTVRRTAEGCEVWTGTQFQTVDQGRVAAIFALKPEQVSIHTTFLGGGFGRRANLPPTQRKMVFIGLAKPEFCATIKDPKRNGGKDLAVLLEHVSHDKLVLWGWDPGVGRAPVAVPHDAFVASFKTWIAGGAPCPETAAPARGRAPLIHSLPAGRFSQVVQGQRRALAGGRPPPPRGQVA